jgi:hypothetical protein
VLAGQVSIVPISSISAGSTPLAFMMCGCLSYWVSNPLARSSAAARSVSTEQATNCGRSISATVRPA